MSKGTSSHQPGRKFSSNKEGVLPPQSEERCEPLTLVLVPSPPKKWHRDWVSPGTFKNMTHDLGWAHSPLLVVPHQVPHALQLQVQPHPVPGQRLQLLAQVAGAALEDGLQAVLAVVQVQLLQELPLGLQHLVLLLQEPHLESHGCYRVPWRTPLTAPLPGYMDFPKVTWLQS